eukprot:6582343-Pyramimonas_sp.AAC.2
MKPRRRISASQAAGGKTRSPHVLILADPHTPLPPPRAVQFDAVLIPVVPLQLLTLSYPLHPFVVLPEATPVRPIGLSTRPPSPDLLLVILLEVPQPPDDPPLAAAPPSPPSAPPPPFLLPLVLPLQRRLPAGAGLPVVQ